MENVHFSSKSNEWETPNNLFSELNNEFNFTLDPCCTEQTAKCKKYYTKEDNGLEKSWKNEIVFVNPPYGREIGKWMQKAYFESLNKSRIVCLIPSRTDTKWWHDYVMKAKEIRYIRGRLKFGNQDNPAPFPSAIVVF